MWLRSRSITNTKLYGQGVTNEMRRHIVVLGLPPECFLLLHVGWQPAAVPGWPAPHPDPPPCGAVQLAGSTGTLLPLFGFKHIQCNETRFNQLRMSTTLK